MKGADAPRDWVRRAVESADCNALRMALLQITGELSFAEMKVETQIRRGGMFAKRVLSAADCETVQARILDALASGPLIPGPVPSKAEARKLIEIFEGRELEDGEAGLAVDELAFGDFPRDATWNRKPGREALDQYHTLVIGAGLSGILAGVHLGRLGIRYCIVDKQAELGGTWEFNRYPDARVDITSFLYQFKFEKNYPWTEYYASRAENQQYLKDLAAKYGVVEHITLGTEAVSARWDEDNALWHVELRGPGGVVSTVSARILISASGLFSTPRVPAIDGIEQFTGRICHTTAWDSSLDLTGKRVAVIGNGSTGTQLLKYIATHAEHVTVYQRTPQWIGPAETYGEKLSPEARWLLDNIPGYWNWLGYASYSESLPFQYYQYRDPDWENAGGRVSEKNEMVRQGLTNYILKQVKGDEALAAKLTPSYAPFARRLVIDNGFYEALTYPNVALVTDGIACISSTGIRATTGEEQPFDLIVLAVGFEVARYFWPMKYTGRDETTLSKAWEKDGPRAYLSLTMPGFPNFFFFYGPNAQGRFLGITTWAEVWWRYIGQVIIHMIENGAHSVECRQEVFEQYNIEIDREMEKIIWSTEGAGGYHTRDFGRSVIHAPWTIQRYNQLLETANMGDFHIRTR